jgi:hypothetical protein
MDGNVTHYLIYFSKVTGIIPEGAKGGIFAVFA